MYIYKIIPEIINVHYYDKDMNEPVYNKTICINQIEIAQVKSVNGYAIIDDWKYFVLGSENCLFPNVMISKIGYGIKSIQKEIRITNKELDLTYLGNITIDEDMLLELKLYNNDIFIKYRPHTSDEGGYHNDFSNLYICCKYELEFTGVNVEVNIDSLTN